jgi:hypothetical protein
VDARPHDRRRAGSTRDFLRGCPRPTHGPVGAASGGVVFIRDAGAGDAGMAEGSSREYFASPLFRCSVRRAKSSTLVTPLPSRLRQCSCGAGSRFPNKRGCGWRRDGRGLLAGIFRVTSVPLQRQTSEIFNARHSSTIPAPSTLVWGAACAAGGNDVDSFRAARVLYDGGLFSTAVSGESGTQPCDSSSSSGAARAALPAPMLGG